MVEIYIYLVYLRGYCVNFPELSIDLVRVKFCECYSYVSKNPRKILNLLFDTFQLDFLFIQKSAFLSVIFGIEKYIYSITLKILW
jgi:hypothetical protein